MLLTMMEWVGLGFSLLLALVLTGHIRGTILRGGYPSPPMRFASLALWILLVASLFSPWSKAHLLWAAPLAAILAFLGGCVRLRLLWGLTRVYANLISLDCMPGDGPVAKTSERADPTGDKIEGNS